MPLSIASMKVFTVWWFLSSSHLLFFGVIFFSKFNWLISWFSCNAKWALGFIFLLNSLKSLVTSFLLYLSAVGQKLRFLFRSLCWYFVNKSFDRLIAFPKGSTRYRFALSIVFHKRLTFPSFGEEILEFGLFKFFFLASAPGRGRVYVFLFLGVCWGCFVSLVMVMMMGLVIGVS